MSDKPNPSNAAIRAAERICKEYEVGQSSVFCDDVEFTHAGEYDKEQIARIIDQGTKVGELRSLLKRAKSCIGTNTLKSLEMREEIEKALGDG